MIINAFMTGVVVVVVTGARYRDDHTQLQDEMLFKQEFGDCQESNALLCKRNYH